MTAASMSGTDVPAARKVSPMITSGTPRVAPIVSTPGGRGVRQAGRKVEVIVVVVRRGGREVVVVVVAGREGGRSRTGRNIKWCCIRGIGTLVVVVAVVVVVVVDKIGTSNGGG